MSVPLPRPRDTQFDYAMYDDVRVPMRDGTELSTYVFFPSKDGVVDFEKKYPVILNRSPYNGAVGPLLGTYPYHMVNYALDHGFAFVLQSVRGTFKSDGEFEAMQNESWGDCRDGVDTLAWIRKQPWSDGRVVTTGASYLGGTQYLMILSGEVPGLETGIIQVPAVNNYDGGWAYAGDFLDANTAPVWGIQMAADPTFLAKLPPEIQAKVVEDLPLLGDPRGLNVAKLLKEYPPREVPVARHMPFYQKWLDHREDPDFFTNSDTTARRHNFPKPLLFISSWYDLFGENAINGYLKMVEDAPSEEVAKGHRLIIGPWSHGYVPTVRKFPEADTDQRLLTMDWFQQQLMGIESEYFRDKPVTLFVMGENRWRSEECWPLPDAVTTPYYLRGIAPANTVEGFGTLSKEKPAEEAADTYNYDPADPIILPGGHQVMGGCTDQRTAEVRPDVLVYNGMTLEEDMEVTGNIQAVLYASTSAEDTDFIVKLTDVCPDGSSYLVSEGGRRGRYLQNGRTNPTPLKPGEIYEITVKMHPTSYVFKKGHQLRVDVCSSDLNNYDRNPNTMADLSTATKEDFVVAVQKVYHDEAHASRIELPVIPADHERRWIEDWPYAAAKTGMNTMEFARPVNMYMENEPKIYPGSELPENRE